jgi:hypothetical protein
MVVAIWFGPAAWPSTHTAPWVIFSPCLCVLTMSAIRVESFKTGSLQFWAWGGLLPCSGLHPLPQGLILRSSLSPPKVSGDTFGQAVGDTVKGHSCPSFTWSLLSSAPSLSRAQVHFLRPHFQGHLPRKFSPPLL